MWRHMQHCIQENQQGDGHRSGSVGGFTIFHGGLLRGAKILNERFIIAWNKDGFRDYLDGNSEGNSQLGDDSIDRPVETVIGIPITRASEGSRRSRGQQSPQLDRTSPLTLPKTTTISSSFKQKNTPQVSVYITDSDSFHDERIKPQQLRKFLQNRPDMALLLWECVVQEGLDNLEVEEDDEDN